MLLIYRFQGNVPRGNDGHYDGGQSEAPGKDVPGVLIENVSEGRHAVIDLIDDAHGGLILALCLGRHGDGGVGGDETLEAEKVVDRGGSETDSGGASEIKEGKNTVASGGYGGTLRAKKGTENTDYK